MVLFGNATVAKNIKSAQDELDEVMEAIRLMQASRAHDHTGTRVYEKRDLQPKTAYQEPVDDLYSMYDDTVDDDTTPGHAKTEAWKPDQLHQHPSKLEDNTIR